jgi:hypothetical protein
MRSKLLVSLIIPGSFLVWTPAPTLGAVQHRHYIRHRTKLQHAKIIGGTALKGASVGGLIAGPPGSAVGAAAGAAAGTAYDLKTRKVKVPPKVPRKTSRR